MGTGAGMCVQVCRAAGYYEHALAVAQAAGEPEWYLDILLEDCHSYDEALVYLQSLPRQQAATALGRHGKVGVLSFQIQSRSRSSPQSIFCAPVPCSPCMTFHHADHPCQ